MNIVIAGASGYIGRALIDSLLKKISSSDKITALSRTQQKSHDPRLEWKACDLFSAQDLVRVLPDTIDCAYYLVHSMLPTAGLDQGNFSDYDLLLSDNFARAVKSRQVKQLIYLGGLIPESTRLSLHLRSRLEVEGVFNEYQIPLVTLRAGLIIGDNGSSFKILTRLIERLPFMVCPGWTQTLTQPITLEHAVDVMVKVFERKTVGRVYDLAICKPVTYLEMMNQTALAMGYNRFFLKIPLFSPKLSRLWVSVVTQTHKNLVYPLIESLSHPMIARQSNLFDDVEPTLTFAELAKTFRFQKEAASKAVVYAPKRNTVRSVQRLVLPNGKTGSWVAEEYIRWLPRFLSPLIKIKIQAEQITISLVFLKLTFLVLEHQPSLHSQPNQKSYKIVTGILVGNKNQGLLEFKEFLNRTVVLAAIHDYKPALPWFIYQKTQAVLHLWVMNAFARHLVKIK